MNRFEKAAAFGAMMGKRAAETLPARRPTPQEQEFADNIRKSMSQPRGIGSVNGLSSNQPNYPTPAAPAVGLDGEFIPINKPPAAGTFPGNSGPSMGAIGPVSSNKAVDPGPPKMKYNNSSEAIVAARREDRRAGKLTEQRLAAMTPEQRQARLDQETQATRAERDRKSAENEAYQKWYAANPGAFGHGITPDHQTMMAMAAPWAPGVGVGGLGSDIPAFAKSFIPQGKGWVPYGLNVAKNTAPLVDPTKLGKPLLTAVESGVKNVGTSWLPRATAAALAGAESYATSNLKSNVRSVPGALAAQAPPGTSMAGQPQYRPGTSMAGQPQATPGTNTVGEPQATPGTNTVGEPQARPGTSMTGTIPNVPRG